MSLIRNYWNEPLVRRESLLHAPSLPHVCLKFSIVKSVYSYNIFTICFYKTLLKLWDEGAVAAWLVYLTLWSRAVRVRALARDIVLCSWARHFTLTVPLSTQVYKWVPANLMLG